MVVSHSGERLRILVSPERAGALQSTYVVAVTHVDKASEPPRPVFASAEVRVKARAGWRTTNSVHLFNTRLGASVRTQR